MRAGAAGAGIADTIGAVDLSAALSPGPIEPPTLRSVLPMPFGAEVS